jgi:hypothetical protein
MGANQRTHLWLCQADQDCRDEHRAAITPAGRDERDRGEGVDGGCDRPQRAGLDPVGKSAHRNPADSDSKALRAGGGAGEGVAAGRVLEEEQCSERGDCIRQSREYAEWQEERICGPHQPAV